MDSLRIDMDDEGYLVDPEEWTTDIAASLAATENIELDEQHWPILNCMRDFYDVNRVAPDVRHVVKFLTAEQGFTKKDAKKHIFTLFPYGYVKQACKISGMKRPRGWSTG